MESFSGRMCGQLSGIQNIRQAVDINSLSKAHICTHLSLYIFAGNCPNLWLFKSSHCSVIDVSDSGRTYAPARGISETRLMETLHVTNLQSKSGKSFCSRLQIVFCARCLFASHQTSIQKCTRAANQSQRDKSCIWFPSFNRVPTF